MKHTLPDLPFAAEALEPHIDAETMKIHHGKHHQGYVNNLNTALEKAPELADKSLGWLMTHLNEVPEAIRTAVRNNGGGHSNHSLFWTLLSPQPGKPSAELVSAVDTELGGFEAFQTSFTQAATTRFGSGWAWLCVNAQGKLQIMSTPNQDTPLSEGLRPILGLDVWEHAYYLKYQNRRADYIAAFWNVVNWEAVSRLYTAS